MINEKKAQKLLKPKLVERFNLQNVKICCGLETVYWKNGSLIETDILGEDNNGDLYSFQVKIGENYSEDDLILKLIKYKNGVHYSYAVLQEQKNCKIPEHIKEVLHQSGIGLITYSVSKNNEIKNIDIVYKADRCHPKYLRQTKAFIHEINLEEMPKVFIFPNIKGEFKNLSELEHYMSKKMKESGYNHTQMRNTPPGSIILFAYGGEIIGEGVVKKTEKGDGKYKRKYIFNPDLVRIFERKITYDDLRELPTFKDTKRVYAKIRYPSELSYPEYFLILKKMTR